MKRALALMFFLVLVIALPGCSKKDKFTEEVYDAGYVAVEATDRFLRGEISADDAHDEVFYQGDIIDENCAPEDADNHFDDFMVSVDVTILSGDLFLYTCYGATRDDVIKSRNELAKNLGLKLYSDR
jgi:hypothetical protein